MPTPVSTARQCLTDEAARALDDAVAVARRRGHAQTTSLHAVSALLALPSSSLREACARARSSAYSPRLQFRALELCVGVSLDRLPSSKAVDEPPVSNSLMAAIKRSQANQRRHPESFHLHQLQVQQQQLQQPASLSCVKVELKHFILSILDDPIVSKVFGEAGFRSYDIKLSILHPPAPPLSRFSRTRCPPLFLCNLPGGDLDPGGRNFSFPFAGCSGSVDGDENCRRIGEILVKKKGKNPLLIGVCASDALASFAECVQGGKAGILQPQIAGLKFVCIKKEIFEFLAGSQTEEQLGLKFEELGHMSEYCLTSGLVVSFGELSALAADTVSGDALGLVVSKLTALLELRGKGIWLIGAAQSYETYLKFLARFPTIEKDWDLQLLPITSSRPSMEGFYSKPSLMGSFVPFGGFFSAPANIKNPLNCINQSEARCHLCNEKYELELSAILKGESGISVSDQYSASLPSWLQMAELDASKGVETSKAKDDGSAKHAKIMGLQKKWNENCQRLHHTLPVPMLDISQARSQIPGAESLQFVADKKQSSSKDSSLNESGSANPSPCMSLDLKTDTPSNQNMSTRAACEVKNSDFQSKQKQHVIVSESQHSETQSPQFPPKPPPNLSLLSDCTSSSSIASVTTDLGLGTLYASTCQEPKNPQLQDRKKHLQFFSASAGSNVIGGDTSKQIAHSFFHAGSNFGGQFDLRDFKSFWRALFDKVGRQDEAICTICQTISRYRTGNGRHHGSNLRGDIWFSFLGPDKLGKKRIATALADIMFGSSTSLISVDLSSQDGFSQPNSIFDCQEVSGYDAKRRGMTVIDFIAGELRRKPHSVVFLENVDKADLLAQSSLSQAVRTGKFPDSHGREISINNMVFVTTSSIAKGNKFFLSESKPVEFSEERILRAKALQMQILVANVAGDVGRSVIGTNVSVAPTEEIPHPGPWRKRKLTETSESSERDGNLETTKQVNRMSKSCLDLNLPVEDTEEGSDFGSSDSDCVSENSEAWLEDFFDQVDEKVVFKPFDFDALAEKILKEINEYFRKIVGSEFVLEIDPEVMPQILAAAWLSDRRRAVENWVERVLCWSFGEAKQRYSLTDRSVVKLLVCKGLPMEEQAPDICLPSRIILN